MRYTATSALFVCAALLVSGQTMESQGRGNPKLRRARQPIANQYIVVVNDGEDPGQVGQDAATAHGGRRLHTFRRAVRGFAMRLTPGAAERLAFDPRVRFVEEDGVVTITQVQVGAPANLDRIDQRFRPIDGSYAYDELAAFVRVHVIDTGIRASHQEFGGRAVIAGDYVDDDGDGDPLDVGNDDPDPSTPDGADCHGHGTHVAGTIGGSTYGVAKQVRLHAHRALNCAGSGSVSGVVAAIEAITADPYRPAVVNMSLGGEPSEVLDAAVRDAIASGITFVVAAGNSFANASNFSPARVAEAITVGATDVNDVRAWFSNYGPSLDLFAPGVSVVSASHTGDTATAVMSGTSMAAPHVAGVAALHLSRDPDLTPEAVQQRIVGAATPNVVSSPWTGSPNRLLYSDLDRLSAPTVNLLQPEAKGKILSGRPYTITWDASDPDGLAGFDVLLSIDGGATYAPIAECTGLSGAARSCAWASPGPETSTARIRVVVNDTGGDVGIDESDANFSIVSLPDLVITATSHSPARLSPGSDFTATDTVRNVGNTSSRTSTTRYYLSVDAVKSTDDTQMFGSRAVGELAADGEASGSASITVPSSVAPGTYTLLACADASRVVTEVDESNNCRAAASNIVIEYADLITTAVTAGASSAAPGRTLSVSDTVLNASAVVASNSWTKYYLSSDAVRDAGDVPLTGSRSVPDLDGGSTSTGSRNVTVPSSTLPGTYRLLACADDTGATDESNESNNCAAAPTTILIEMPDLATISVSTTATTVAPGANISITDTVLNTSSVATTSTTTRYYLSIDAIRSPDDTLFTSTRYLTGVAPGGTSTGSRTVNLPDDTPSGQYRLLACADDLQKLDESNESNNCAASVSTLLVALPDLAVTSISEPPATVQPDDFVSVRDTVTNLGLAPTSGWTAVRYYLSLDAVQDAGDVLFAASRSVPALDAGESASGTRSVRVPATIAPGTYYLLACADGGGVVPESDEGNNCRASTTTTTVAGGGE